MNIHINTYTKLLASIRVLGDTNMPVRNASITKCFNGLTIGGRLLDGIYSNAGEIKIKVNLKKRSAVFLYGVSLYPTTTSQNRIKVLVS